MFRTFQISVLIATTLLATAFADAASPAARRSTDSRPLQQKVSVRDLIGALQTAQRELHAVQDRLLEVKIMIVDLELTLQDLSTKPLDPQIPDRIDSILQELRQFEAERVELTARESYLLNLIATLNDEIFKLHDRW